MEEAENEGGWRTDVVKVLIGDGLSVSQRVPVTSIENMREG